MIIWPDYSLLIDWWQEIDVVHSVFELLTEKLKIDTCHPGLQNSMEEGMWVLRLSESSDTKRDILDWPHRVYWPLQQCIISNSSSEGKIVIFIFSSRLFYLPSVFFSIKFDQVIFSWLNLWNLQGHLKATTDLSEYGFSAGWVEFGWVEGLTLTGGGTLDGQGAKAWPYNDCPTDSNCKLLPTVCFMTYNCISLSF